MSESQTPEEIIAELQRKIAESAQEGVASTSVDGVSVAKQSSADQKIALDEAKKAAVNRIPMTMCTWR